MHHASGAAAVVAISDPVIVVVDADVVALLLLAADTVDEALSSLLNLVWQGEVVVGTARPGERTLLHSRP